MKEELGKILTLTVGLPQSGKTTWAKQAGRPIVSPDAIRLALHGKAFLKEAEPLVWAIARYMVAALFLAGHSHVIVDACNISEKRRREWQDERWSLSFKEFDTPADVCIERALAAGRPDLVPVIQRMAAEREPINLNGASVS